MERPPQMVQPVTLVSDLEYEDEEEEDEGDITPSPDEYPGIRLQPTVSGIPSSPPPLLSDPPLFAQHFAGFGTPAGRLSVRPQGARPGGGRSSRGRPSLNPPSLVIPPVVIDGVTVPSPSPVEHSPDEPDELPDEPPNTQMFHWPFATRLPVISPGFTQIATNQTLQSQGSGFTRPTASRADAFAAAAAIVAGLADDAIETNASAAPQVMTRQMSRGDAPREVMMSRPLGRQLSRALSTELWDIPLSTVPSLFFSATPRRQPTGVPTNIGATAAAAAAAAAGSHDGGRGGKQNGWSVGLCAAACTHPPLLCLESLVCPCVTVTRVAAAVDPANAQCGSSCALSVLAGILSCHLYSAHLRTKVRSKYGVGGSSCGDCCTHFCCHPCALMQEVHELQVHGDVSFASRSNKVAPGVPQMQRVTAIPD